MFGGGALHTKKQVMLRQQVSIGEFNSILTLSTWRQHQTPQVKGSAPEDCPWLQKLITSRVLSPAILTHELQTGGLNNTLTPTQNANSKFRLSPVSLMHWLEIKGSYDSVLGLD